MATIESNRCFICRKIFCCSDCCFKHINKHSNSDCVCPLCHGESLTIRNFHHPRFLSHVVFNHLPLYCKICGEYFRNYEDLLNLSTCRRHPLIKVEPPTCLDIESSTLSSVSDSTSEISSLVVKTPSNLSVLRKSISFTVNSSSYFKNSPPQLTRYTSTPMHVGIFKAKFNATTKSPNICLNPTTSIQSPSSDSDKDEGSQQASSNLNNNNSTLNSLGDTVYQDFSSTKNSSERTPLRSILSLRSHQRDVSEQNFFRNSSERKLEAMQESEEFEFDAKNVQDIYSTPETVNNDSESLASSTSSWKTRRDSKDSGKKVRFSDQFIGETHDNKKGHVYENDTIDASEADEFFEACQSFSHNSSVPDKDQLDVNHNKSIDEKNAIDKVEKLTDEDIRKHNKKNEVKEDMIKKCTTGSSRVVMMVVMDNTGDINARELSPIIDSSLKKLQSFVSSPPKPTNSSNALLELVNQHDKDLDTSRSNNNHDNSGFAMVSIDSYTRVSSVECIEESETTPDIRNSQSNSKPSNSNGGGIFSTVANALKNAFKNLSGVPRNSSITPLIKTPKSPTLPASTLSLSALETSTISSSTSWHEESSTLSQNSSKTSKRPREEIYSPPVSPENKLNQDCQNSLVIIRSPLHKKARNWYKQVRSRQPISRMKNSNNSINNNNNTFACLRGISHETQYFQQGAFTVRDTILPLPVRAYQVDQSTQTEF